MPRLRIISAMHLLIPFAAPLSEAGRQALQTLSLPQLSALLAGMQPQRRDDGDELSLSPPHERALARAMGWAGEDGALPWAAWWMRVDGLDPGDQAWGQLTPSHWHLGTEQLSMGDPEALALDEATSRALLAAVQALFTSEGFVVHWGAPLRWYISHPSLADLPCASPDRVIGRNVDRWLPAGTQARLLRRLQNEVQMLLYTLPLNAEREARGALPVNSFWLSACGVAQATASAMPQVDARLRSYALAEDWAGWSKAWAVIDEGLVAADIEQVTLCGERSSATWAIKPRGAFKRFMARWNKPDPVALLETL